jgi:hypothetical protein
MLSDGFFFVPDMTYFEKKNFTLFRPQSADRTSVNKLQRSRKHFQTLAVILNMLLLMPNADSNPFFSDLNN